MAQTLNCRGVELLYGRHFCEKLLRKKKNKQKNVGPSNSIKPSTGHAYKRKGATQSRIKRDKIAVLEHVPKNQSLFYISAKARRERFLKENPRGLSSPNQ